MVLEGGDVSYERGTPVQSASRQVFSINDRDFSQCAKITTEYLPDTTIFPTCVVLVPLYAGNSDSLIYIHGEMSVHTADQAALTPNTLELIPTLGALSFRG